MNKFFPWIIICVIAAITIFFAFQLPKAVFDNDISNFIPSDSEEMKAFDAQQELYGSSDILLMALRNPKGTVFEKDFLLKLQDLTKRLEALPQADTVTSLTNTDYIRGEGDSIVVSPLVGDDFTGTPEEINVLKKGLLSWDLYKGSLVSDDYRSTQILVSIRDFGDQDKQGKSPQVDNKQVIYEEIQRILVETGISNQDVYLAGFPVMAVLLSKNMSKDLMFLIPLVLLVLIICLYLSFKRLGGVVLPLLTVVITSIWTLGLMVVLDIKLTLMATVTPVVLVAVGCAYGIHFLTHYYDEILIQEHPLTKPEHDALVLGVLRNIRMPVALAGLTTMAGFGSLSLISITPIRHFGLFSTFGVFSALVVAMTLIPSLLIIRGPLAIKGSTGYKPDKDPLSRWLLRIFTPFIHHPKTTIALSGLLVVVSIFGTTMLVADSAIIEFFREDTEVSRSDAFLRKEFNGTKTFNINVKGTQKGDLNDPQTLAAMEGLANYLKSEFPEVGKVVSYSQFIKRINQVLNADEPAEGLRGTVETVFADSTEIEELGFGFEDVLSEAELSNPVISDDSTSQLTRVALLELLNQAYVLSDRQDIEVSDLLSLINRTVNYEGAAYYEIPTDPQRYNQANQEGLKNLIGNYLVLIGSGTEEWSDDALEPSQARMSVQLNSTGNITTGKIADAIHAYVADNFPAGVTVELAGLAFIEKGVVDLIVSTQMWNILASLIMVFLVVSIFFKSLWAGLLAIVPLSVTILVNFGLMGISGIKLDVATSMVAAITIGTGIDYTIHFLVAFHRGKKINGNFHTMMEHTILTTGKAIMFNAVSVSAGFAVLVFSAFNPLRNLGLLIAITMLTSSFVSLTLLPVLLDLFKPKFLDKPMLNELLGGK